MSFNNVLSPLSVKAMTLRNRIVMPPIGTNFANIDGSMNKDHLAYYEQRAQGGTGLIILENVCIDYPMGTNGTTQLRMDNDQYLPGLYKFTERMHFYGACCSVQINHAGASASPLRLDGLQQVSASNLPSKKNGAIPRPLTQVEIKSIIEKYAEGAHRAQRAGFDAVEIHAGHSYLISQFLSPITNNRKDEYGGSIENRARFAKEVVEAIRKAVGNNFPIMLRFSADEFLENGNTLEETLDLLEYFVEEIDILDVSCALNDSLFYQIDVMHLEDGWRSYLSKAVKERFPHKLTIVSGNIRTPFVAEKIIKNNESDLIAMGRGLIAEPNWVKKVESGRIEELRKCISCNIGCADHRIRLGRPIRCTVNPDIFYEDDYKLSPVKHDVKVAVIGGGTAGLEAACTAAELNCTVDLYEQKSYLGGLSVDISKLPEKRRIEDFSTYLIQRANKLECLSVHLNTQIQEEDIEEMSYDLIVNATGSVPLLPPIKGLLSNLSKDDKCVHTIFDLIHNMGNFKETQDKNIVIVGGGAVGLDVAEYYTKRNAKSVKVIELQDEVGKDLDLITKLHTLHVLDDDRVEMLTDTKLIEVKENSFVVEHRNQEKELFFDEGFVCLGMKSFNPLLEKLGHLNATKGIKILNIGDSKRARKIIDGVREAHDIISVLHRIDEEKERDNEQ
ncbi:FAD-dependent oxidoreductase [Erysipelothrix urinaevulpis]|uniref:oxidoreductase n=1 Tax=Erysipelothrix urinaevulpis TaxID=2683717 RepID=UPI001359DB14|nr:FAD-dependent oxidoreductase [Erysipelothrix urinaevulpis]